MSYVIWVKGHLDPFWHAWFENLLIMHDGDGTILLSGCSPSAALEQTTQNSSSLMEDTNEEQR